MKPEKRLGKGEKGMIGYVCSRLEKTPQNITSVMLRCGLMLQMAAPLLLGKEFTFLSERQLASLCYNSFRLLFFSFFFTGVRSWNIFSLRFWSQVTHPLSSLLNQNTFNLPKSSIFNNAQVHDECSHLKLERFGPKISFFSRLFYKTTHSFEEWPDQRNNGATSNFYFKWSLRQHTAVVEKKKKKAF